MGGSNSDGTAFSRLFKLPLVLACNKSMSSTVSSPRLARRLFSTQPAVLKVRSLSALVAGSVRYFRANRYSFGNLSAWKERRKIICYIAKICWPPSPRPFFLPRILTARLRSSYVPYALIIKKCDVTLQRTWLVTRVTFLRLLLEYCVTFVWTWIGCGLGLGQAWTRLDVTFKWMTWHSIQGNVHVSRSFQRDVTFLD